MRIDSTVAVGYLTGAKFPGEKNAELQSLVRTCLRDKAAVETAYRCRIDIRQQDRNTSRDHRLCDHASRKAMRAGRDERIRPNCPHDWLEDISQISPVARRMRELADEDRHRQARVQARPAGAARVLVEF